MFIGRYYSTCAALKNPKLQSKCLKGCTKGSLPLASRVTPTPSSSTCFISADSKINVLDKQPLLAQVRRTRKPNHFCSITAVTSVKERSTCFHLQSQSKQIQQKTTVAITQTCAHMCSVLYVLGFSLLLLYFKRTEPLELSCANFCSMATVRYFLQVLTHFARDL